MRFKKTAPQNQQKGSASVSMFVSLTLSFLFICLSFLLISNSVQSVITAYNREQLLGQAEDEVRELRLRNLALMQEKEDVTNDSYVEEEARNRLNYVKEDEVLVILPETGDEDVEGVETEAEVEEEPEVEGKSWERWWILLRDGV